jgi:hypothetical protein
MSLLHLTFLTVVALAALLLVGLYWLESRRPEVRRRADAPAPPDPPAVETGHETPGAHRQGG